MSGGAGVPDDPHPAAAATPPAPSNQPATSIRTSALPAKLDTDTRPSAPRPTVTMFGTVPTTAFTFDEPGCGWPDGHTVR